MIGWFGKGFALFLLTSLFLGFSPEERNDQEIDIALGHGRYDYFSGCAMKRTSFNDASINFRYSGGPWKKGVSIGTVHGRRGVPLANVAYLSHYFGRDWSWIGIDLRLSAFWDYSHGVFFPLPGGTMRFGPERTLYGTISIFDSDPFFTGGGFMNFGLGRDFGSHRLWAGFSNGPYLDVGWMLRWEWLVSDRYRLQLISRNSVEYRPNQYGYMLGFGWRL